MRLRSIYGMIKAYCSDHAKDGNYCTTRWYICASDAILGESYGGLNKYTYNHQLAM